MGKSEQPVKSPDRRYFHAAVLVVITIVAYIPAMNGGFIWDDDDYVTDNPTLHDLDGLKRIWIEPKSIPQWYPMVHTTYWIEYHIWELHPFGYHLVNVLLHASSAMLLWMLLRKLRVPGSWLAAAIFALHPVHVESVGWITERKNTLATLFYLGAMLSYFRFALPQEGPSANRAKPYCFYALSLVLFACALLSKSITATLPAALLVLLLWKRSLTWKVAISTIPMFVMGIGLGIYTVWLEKTHVGAEGWEWSLSLVQRFILAGRVLWFYAGKLLVPYKLIFNYPRWDIDVGWVWGYLFPAGVVVLVWVLWALRKKTGYGPLVAVLLFTGTLFPALGFFDVYPFRYSFVADHFQYPASIALIALFASIIALGIGKLQQQAKHLGYAGCAALLIVLGVLTWNQGHIYKDKETLYRDTIAKNPRSWFAMGNLGSVLHKQGKIDEAIPWYRKALEVRGPVPETQKKLGMVLLDKGDLPEAIYHFREALKYDPDFPEAHYLLGMALGRANMYTEAIKHYQYLTQWDKQSKVAKTLLAQAHNNLGTIYFERQALPRAAGHFRRALHFDPKLYAAHSNLGIILGDLGEYTEAKKHFEMALRGSESPLIMIEYAWLLASSPDTRVRDGARALEMARRACEQDKYRSARFLDVLGAAYAEQGDFDTAVVTAERALRAAISQKLPDQILQGYRSRLELYRNHRTVANPRGIGQ